MEYGRYVGARYVPLFDGDWNDTKNYEPLTIVFYDEKYYTSRVVVPAGTLPTNTEYWAMTGGNSGGGEYEARIAALEALTDTLQTDVQAAQSTADSAASAASDAQTAANNAASAASAAQSKVEQVEQDMIYNFEILTTNYLEM